MAVIRHHDYHHINGVRRNAVTILTNEELRAMSAELRSRRRTDKTSRWERRREYLKSIKGDTHEQI